jgi:hypothetical protein
MVRRLVIGTIAAAALLAVGLAGHAQAQSSCTYAGNNACGELRFNDSPDPRDARPATQIAGQAQMPPAGQSTAQAGQSTSQAAPQAEMQPAGEE